MTGSLLSTLWTLPNTLLGALLGDLVGARVVSRAGDALHLLADRDSRLANWLSERGWAALALGEVIIYWGGDFPEARLMRHELAHVRQYRAFGPLFLPAYLAASLYSRIRHGNWHRDNAFEVAARRAS